MNAMTNRKDNSSELSAVSGGGGNSSRPMHSAIIKEANSLRKDNQSKHEDCICDECFVHYEFSSVSRRRNALDRGRWCHGWLIVCDIIYSIYRNAVSLYD